MRVGYAMMAIALGAFVLGTVVQEFYRGMRARHRMHGESPVVAISRLIGRNRRRYGGYIVHVGILTMFVAFAGMAFKVDQEATLKPGETAEVRSPYGHTYKLTHMGVSQYKALNRFVSAASVQVERDGRSLGIMKSEGSMDSFGAHVRTLEEVASEHLRHFIVYAGSVDGMIGGVTGSRSIQRVVVRRRHPHPRRTPDHGRAAGCAETRRSQAGYEALVGAGAE
jgi:cytochrome c biogenesis factor